MLEPQMVDGAGILIIILNVYSSFHMRFQCCMKHMKIPGVKYDTFGYLVFCVLSCTFFMILLGI